MLEHIWGTSLFGRLETFASVVLMMYLGNIVNYCNAETDTGTMSPIPPTSEDVGPLGGFIMETFIILKDGVPIAELTADGIVRPLLGHA